MSARAQSARTQSARTQSARTAPRRPVAVLRRTTYARQVSMVLAAAFVLSVAHTIYSSAAGIADPGFEVSDPGVWAFYAAAFGVAWLARREARWAQAVVLAFLGVLLAISILVYPSMFGPEQQTTFGWIENDVYVGLLMIAGHLSVLRLRGVGIAAGPALDA
ncbi:hypothetical protein E8D34_04315 [Nocardioides sp. GY 10113]|uniref:hypothetical protein n=1 Tax=Nocardioides sp. GY 10113 TaxID=2569761 RepID=UPI0010A8C110|nr:hypothetical protein [Nocardioides sp. GY 10113]TIC88880.1 hypothetical protein E8D34_04315 [Nocardioides sp. GY 10113]